MATSERTMTFLVDQLQEAGPVSAKKMFGEYGLFLDGRMFGIIADEQLFFKPTEAGRRLFPEAPYAAPYPGAKPCMCIPPERWDDPDWLAPLARATAAELPLPKPKKPKA
ncbi:TfoX/Sxy family protein [Mesoterricola sediminis]|uniref:Competence protein TfoX n=1 Tax=Mesoterricola sediminis TaxID=2927980 RepID=A0AA48KCZ0_9BACT|nr:TfoX/Sxy family protein [Mesoterricola sediminis]BDU77631.1 competence protein TfoX [Mesoterricola sediminis]